MSRITVIGQHKSPCFRLTLFAKVNISQNKLSYEFKMW